MQVAICEERRTASKIRGDLPLRRSELTAVHHRLRSRDRRP